MQATGGCYCGDVTYKVDGEPVMEAQCHCRPCQYISGGGPNYFLIVSEDAFKYTSGAPKQFARSDLEEPRTREFCPTCGTHLVTRLPGRPLVVVKVGTLDAPSDWQGPKFAIHCKDIQPFHTVADGMPRFDGLPTK